MDVQINKIKELSEKYEVPRLDLLLMGLNLNGVNLKINNPSFNRISRGRFNLKPVHSERTHFFAVTVTEKSPYLNDNKNLYLGDELIGSVGLFENDTCDDTYFRRDGQALTLNSNSRSRCKGCQFCGAYTLNSADKNDLTTEERFSAKIEDIIKTNGLVDFAKIKNVGVVTGCFRDEEKTLSHLLMLRRVLTRHNFSGEIEYIGSQITSQKSLDLLADSGPLSLYLTVECFERREHMMKPIKSAVTLKKGREILVKAKDRGINTSILYILGLDSLESIDREFRKYLYILTKHPVINLMQSYTSNQSKLRHLNAGSLDYYIEARKIIESIFLQTNLRPELWKNYRSPWVSIYGGERLE